MYIYKRYGKKALDIRNHHEVKQKKLNIAFNSGYGHHLVPSKCSIVLEAIAGTILQK